MAPPPSLPAPACGCTRSGNSSGRWPAGSIIYYSTTALQEAEPTRRWHHPLSWDRYKMDRYERALAARPLATNMVGSGVLFLGGDIICQAIQLHRSRGGKDRRPFSLPRALRMALHGSCVNATLYSVFLTGLKCARPPSHPLRLLSAAILKAATVLQQREDMGVSHAPRLANCATRFGMAGNVRQCPA
eukprot:COSAG05_NODE_9005_length_655_cov_0.829137_1_plen_188_part_00